ncbi:MAG: TIGR02757 family protein [Bacteroidetes bacterium]|nr:MAG: TIGR02757 family protein [Bacteroidota bacterium]
MTPQLIDFLNQKQAQYNQRGFIGNDPIVVPHAFSKLQDIEIAGFFAAIFAWGNRTTIINKSKSLMEAMQHAPHDFVLHHGPQQLKALLTFKHRTFNADDLLFFIEFLQQHYRQHNSLETAFTRGMQPGDAHIENALIGFKQYMFGFEHLRRTQKHVSSPLQNSSCKRLCMYLRWMVRHDAAGVDFGLWKTISPAQLVCPMDVHVARAARQYGLFTRKQPDWLAALELTNNLKKLDPTDPVKYDFALFGLGVME